MHGRLGQAELAADLGDAEVALAAEAEQQQHVDGALDGGDRLAAALGLVVGGRLVGAGARGHGSSVRGARSGDRAEGESRECCSVQRNDTSRTAGRPRPPRVRTPVTRGVRRCPAGGRSALTHAVAPLYCSETAFHYQEQLTREVPWGSIPATFRVGAGPVALRRHRGHDGAPEQQHEGDLAAGWYGMTASSFSASASTRRWSRSAWPEASRRTPHRATGVFAVNILGKDQAEIGKRFAGMLGGEVHERFAGLGFRTAEPPGRRCSPTRSAGSTAGSSTPTPAATTRSSSARCSPPTPRGSPPRCCSTPAPGASSPTSCPTDAIVVDTGIADALRSHRAPTRARSSAELVSALRDAGVAYPRPRPQPTARRSGTTARACCAPTCDAAPGTASAVATPGRRRPPRPGVGAGEVAGRRPRVRPRPPATSSRPPASTGIAVRVVIARLLLRRPGRHARDSPSRSRRSAPTRSAWRRRRHRDAAHRPRRAPGDRQPRTGPAPLVGAARRPCRHRDRPTRSPR